MADRFGTKYVQSDDPGVDGFVVSPSDSTIFNQPSRLLYVGTGGDVCVQMLSYNNANTILTYKNVQNGATLPIRVVKVFANTTANDIIGIY
jgi:hypothetical protein